MALWAQLASYAVSQQEKSRAQMVSQHCASTQPGEVLGAQQSFAFGAPHCAKAMPAKSIGVLKTSATMRRMV
jgi:hypothetical protein